jgi:hypothetical protein
MSKRLKKADKIANIIGDAEDIQQRIQENSQSIKKARKMLSSIQRGASSEERRRKLHIEFDDIMHQIDHCASDLSLLLLQRYFLNKRGQSYGKGAEKRILRHFTIPPETMIVAKRFLNEAKEAIFGINFCTKYEGMAPIVTACPYPDYMYSKASNTVFIPPQDSGKMCRWSSLAHEVCHSKVNYIAEVFKTPEGPENDFAEALLGQKWREIRLRWSRLEEEFVRKLKLRIGEAYRAISSMVGEDFVIPNALLSLQFAEMICDIVTAKICGPSDLFFLGWQTAPDCRNPFLGMQRHLLLPDHPPDMTRLAYEFVVLQTGENDLRGLERFSSVGDMLDGISSYDVKTIPVEQRDPRHDLSEYLNAAYEAVILDHLEKDIIPLADLLLGGRPQYGKDRWNKAISNSVKLEKGEDLDPDLRPYDLTNIAWVLVLNIFEKTIGKNGNYVDFWRMRRRKKVLYHKLWGYLI